ncbi:MAG: hypothetical protein WA766_11805 [Candidatus Acidiferrales bacterium]
MAYIDDGSGIQDKASAFFNVALSKNAEMAKGWRGFRAAGARMGTGSAFRGAKIGYEMGFKGGSLFVIGGAAYGAYTAPRHHKISEALGQGTSFGVTSLLGGVIGGAVGGPIGAYVGSFAAQILAESTVANGIAGIVQPIVDFGTNMRKQRFGGDYRDTQTAYTMRGAAAREMSRSLLNARQWLGQESAFLHQ